MTRKLTLSLVDDDLDFLAVLKLRFTRLDYNVIAVSHPRDAEIAAREQPIHAALVDLGFADADGLALIEPLGTALGSPPVVVLSGYTDDQTKTDAQAKGACMYLIKPGGLAEIEAAVTSAVALHSSSRSTVSSMKVVS